MILQGSTGQHASCHAEDGLPGRTRIVGGVTPGKRGVSHLGLPVFDTVHKAVQATGADLSGVFVSPVAASLCH